MRSLFVLYCVTLNYVIVILFSLFLFQLTMRHVILHKIGSLLLYVFISPFLYSYTFYISFKTWVSLSTFYCHTYSVAIDKQPNQLEDTDIISAIGFHLCHLTRCTLRDNIFSRCNIGQSAQICTITTTIKFL